MTKPEYVQFCNRIHLLDLRASKGDMDREEAGRARQTLMAELAGSGTKGAAREEPRQRTGALTWSRQAPSRRPPATEPRPRRLPRPVKRRKYDGRIIPGGVRTRKHYNKWQKLRRKRWDELLNSKRDAESVVKGAAELTQTTQRLIPAPRKRRGKRNLRVINLRT